MSRLFLSRTALLVVNGLLLLSLLVACGGGDDDGDDNGGNGIDFPVPGGADNLGSADADSEELGTTDIDVSDGQVTAYRVSDSSLQGLADYYESGLDEDWTVENSLAIGEVMFAVVHNDGVLGVVSAMGAEQARSEGAGELGDLEIDMDEFADDDLLLMTIVFRCNEDSIDTCIDAMGLGL